ncbi:BRCT domain-containing protein [Frigoriflavimonas asaccharolytica]|uniref:NAD-dependent DNA ligase n=1 Tax=Frigoriflavimonas asaccharolytica TaxID=2735899 RepID=A0A8J8K573_9FLAO|nr:BRCT domain-containing protein [Frigoriflavimonas asaccharolytica]NRS92505.1 NAD-dependent DNA ligase [Frigoriflavimonas asaccharolytica]
MNLEKFDTYDRGDYKKFSNPSAIEKDLQTLIGIINGIQSDNEINEKERAEVQNWINYNREYENKSPYREIISLLRESLSDEILTQDECQNIILYCEQYINKSGYYTVITSGIQKLLGIIKGISIDKEINIQELTFLKDWLDDNDYLKNTYPFDEIYNLTLNVILDKVITDDEHKSFMEFCTAISGESDNNTESLLESLKIGFYQIDPEIIIQEKTFCVTGVSQTYKRKEIAEKIEMYGGFVTNSVSSKLDYLIVCDEKNACWAFTCYGKKIEQAIKYRKNGKNLIIVHEFDLFDTIDSL